MKLPTFAVALVLASTPVMAQINITPDTSSPLQTSGGSSVNVIIDTTAGSTGDIGSEGSPFLLEQSGFLTILEVGSITANLDDGNVYLDGTDLFFSGDLTVSPSNFTNGIVFNQGVTSSGSNTAFDITGGIFDFEGDFSIQSADVTVSDAGLGISDFLFIAVNSTSDFGTLTGDGSVNLLAFNSGSTLQIDTVSGLSIGDSFDLIENFNTITGEPTTVAVSVDGTDEALTEVGSSGVYTGTVEGTEFEFDLNTGILSVIPEPTTATMIGLGGVFLLARRRQIRR